MLLCYLIADNSWTSFLKYGWFTCLEKPINVRIGWQNGAVPCRKTLLSLIFLLLLIQKLYQLRTLMVCTIVDLLLPVWLLLLCSFPFVFNNISLLPKKEKEKRQRFLTNSSLPLVPYHHQSKSRGCHLLNVTMCTS